MAFDKDGIAATGGVITPMETVSMLVHGTDRLADSRFSIS